MLVGVPPAPREIQTWQEALDLVKARSTDLRTSYDNVLIAEAQERIALAQILPQLGGGAAPIAGVGNAQLHHQYDGADRRHQPQRAAGLRRANDGPPRELRLRERSSSSRRS